MTPNVRIFLFLETILAGAGGFILPIYVLYFRWHRIDLFEVAALAAVFEASVLIFELPTGLFADRYGRKLSVNLGFALYAVSGLTFILIPRFVGFVIAEIIFGLAEAFISGAGEALAVDSIVAAPKEVALRKMYVWRSRLRISATIVMMLAAGHLFVRNVYVTFIPVVAGGLIGLAASLMLQEGKKAADDQAKFSFVAPLRLMWLRLNDCRPLKIIFVISLVANFSFEGADQYWQILAAEVYALEIPYFGLLTAAGAVLAFIVVGWAVSRFHGGLSLPLLFLLLSGVIISSLPNSSGVLLPILLILYFFTKEIVRPLFSVALNTLVDSAGRATFLSGYNLTCSVGEVASGLAVGLVASRLGLPVVFIVCGTVLVLSVVGALFAGGTGRQQIS